MFSFFVFAAHGQFRLGMAGHIGVIVRGVEQNAVGAGSVQLPYPFKKHLGDLFYMLLGNPIPFFPVSFAGELLKVNGSDMLDGGALIPGSQLVFTDRLNGRP